MSCQIRLNPTLARTVCYQIWSREMTQNDHWSFLTTWNLEWKRTPLFSYKGVYCLEARPTIHLLPEGGSGEGVLHALTLGSPSALVYLLSLSLRFLSAWEIISRLEMKRQHVGNIHLLSLLIPFPVWKKEKRKCFTAMEGSRYEHNLIRAQAVTNTSVLTTVMQELNCKGVDRWCPLVSPTWTK